MVNISLEEQRQANWFMIEKRNEKKTVLIRYLLHSDASFDEDDFSNAVPLMIQLLSRRTLAELQDAYFKQRQCVIMSKFCETTVCSENCSSGCNTDISESSDEDYDYIADNDDGSFLNSWIAFEQPMYGSTDQIQKVFRSLDSIAEEREPSEDGSIYTAIDDPSKASFDSGQDGSDAILGLPPDGPHHRSINHERYRVSGDVTASSQSRATSISDIQIEIP